MIAARVRRSAAVCALLAAATGGVARAQTTTVYVAFGDSVTAGTGDEEQSGGYPPRLQALLEGDGQSAQVRNRGLGGETTTEGLARIDSVLLEGGDVLLLMEGTNDIARNISPETTEFNLEQMASRAEAAGMDAVIATVIPRIDDAHVDSDSALTQRRNEGIRDLAGTSGRDLADPFEVFITTDDVFDRFYSDDPEDQVGHPNAAGYDLLAGVFFDVLTGVDSVPPVTGVTLPATGRTGVRPSASIRMDVWDFGEGIDILNTKLLINGQLVPAETVATERRVRLEYNPPGPLSGLVELGLRSRDQASPPNVVDRVVTHFRIAGAELDGDLDESDRVDGADLVIFALSFGATSAESRYLPEADFNRDDVVDGDDLAVLASNFGQER
jgi:lysophospholipase L1-like esterase